MQGKTAEEIAQLAQQLYGVASAAVAQPAPQPMYQPPPQPAPDPWGVRDDDYVDGRTFKQALTNAVQAIAPSLQASAMMAADNTLSHIKQQHAKEFQKWGPEILGYIQQVPLQSRTVDNLKGIIDFVKGRHVEEYALERAQELAAQQNATFRPMGGSGSLGGSPNGASQPTISLDSEDLPERYRATLKTVGVTWDTVREYCAKTGTTPQEWFEMAKKNANSMIVEKPGAIR